MSIFICFAIIRIFCFTLFIIFNCRIDRVVEGFVKAIEDEGNNGKSLLVSTESIDYFNLPSFEDSEIFGRK